MEAWAIAPLNVAKAMTNLQSQQTSNPSSISQYATLAAIEGDQRERGKNASRIRGLGRDLGLQAVVEHAGYRLSEGPTVCVLCVFRRLVLISAAR